MIFSINCYIPLDIVGGVLQLFFIKGRACFLKKWNIMSSSPPDPEHFWPVLKHLKWHGVKLCCPPPAMSQLCWRPPSPTAAGLPSGWRCRPAGPVWSSTSGCCWVLCAAVSLNPDPAAHASNAAQDPPVTSLSVSDTLCEGPGRQTGGQGAMWMRGQMTLSLPAGALQEGIFRNGGHRGQGSKTHSAVRRTNQRAQCSVPCWYVKNWIKPWCHRLDTMKLNH